MSPWTRHRPGEEADRDLLDRGFVARLHPVARAFERYFRYEVQGLEHVPRDGAALLVSTHSIHMLDACLLAARIDRELGRTPRGLADHFFFTVPRLRELVLRLGAVDGTRDNAVRLLARGELCFAMPGGAGEAFRPSSEAYRLRWDGHTGYVRVALRAGVPVIPTACHGADEVYWVPYDAMALGRALTGRRLPLPFVLGWGLLPRPVKLTQRVGPPIRFPHGPSAADDPDVVAQCHATVQTAIRTLMQR